MRTSKINCKVEEKTIIILCFQPTNIIIVFSSTLQFILLVLINICTNFTIISYCGKFAARFTHYFTSFSHVHQLFDKTPKQNLLIVLPFKCIINIISAFLYLLVTLNINFSKLWITIRVNIALCYIDLLGHDTLILIVYLHDRLSSRICEQ